MDPCEKYLDDIIGEGPQTDFLTRVRGAGQGCWTLAKDNYRGRSTAARRRPGAAAPPRGSAHRHSEGWLRPPTISPAGGCEAPRASGATSSKR